MHNVVKILTQGGIIAYPTESVYGLGCDPYNLDAIHKLLRLKQRAPTKGFILVAANFAQLNDFIAPITQDQLQRALDTWPGPYTWTFPVKENVPELLRGDHPSIAVRVSAHPVVQQLCTAWGKALISTSANLAGHPPAKTAAEVDALFADQIDWIVSGDVGDLDQPTPIRDVVSGQIWRD